MDVLFVITLYEKWASHLGKREAMNIPLLRYVIEPLELIMVGRDKKDSKEDRDQLVSDISEH